MSQGCSYQITLVSVLNYFSFLILAPGKKEGGKGKGKGVGKCSIPRPQQPAPHPTSHPPRVAPPPQAHRVKVTPNALRAHDGIMDAVNHMYRGRRLTHLAREKSGILFIINLVSTIKIQSKYLLKF